VSDQARTRVLLVDDEEAITSTLAPFLERSGFDVRVEADGQSALDAHAAFAPHIVVSDVLMPRMDGRELVRRLRRADAWTPVIMLTKVDASFERTAALEEGADDYLGKPFDPPELVARIRAVLRRTAGGGKPLTASSQLVSAGLRLDRVARRVHRDGATLELTPKALTLLEYLMSHPDEVHTREHLLETLWGFEFAVTTRAVDHRVAELRRALGDDAQQPRWIETLPGAGYRFCAPVSAS
jgi:DNA-binding response OmpR family regulator